MGTRVSRWRRVFFGAMSTFHNQVFDFSPRWKKLMYKMKETLLFEKAGNWHGSRSPPILEHYSSLCVSVMKAAIRKNVFVMAVSSCRPSLSVYNSSHTRTPRFGAKDFLSWKIASVAFSPTTEASKKIFFLSLVIFSCVFFSLDFISRYQCVCVCPLGTLNTDVITLL